MTDHVIYALKVDEDWRGMAFDALKEGRGRFGWSFVPTADLRSLKQRSEQDGWSSLSGDEQDCYQRFLLDIRPRDYVVYINVPKWGQCTLARVNRAYEWEWDEKVRDFSHRIPVDPATVIKFDRNDSVVPRYLSARLKLKRRWWRVYAEREFEQLLASLKEGHAGKQSVLATRMQHLRAEITPALAQITDIIQRNNPNYDLEEFFEAVFQRVPGVKDVKRTGRGGSAGDEGADLVVTYEAGLPPWVEQQTCVVQIKSYTGEHWDDQAVKDIDRALEAYADHEPAMGLIVSTANKLSPSLEQELDDLGKKGRGAKEDRIVPVHLLIGPDLAAFVLRYAGDLLEL